MINKIQNKVANNKLFYILLFIIISIGIGLRVYIYLQQFSFERDEAHLILALLDKTSYYEICFTKLNVASTIPHSFLLLSKLLMNIFGINELAIRAIPLCSGVASIILFYFFAKKYLSSQSLLIAVLLFSIAPKLIQYSSFFKPYSTDIFIALILLIFADYFFDKENINILFPAVLGGLLLYFSLPSIFILASIGIYYVYIFLKKKQKDNFLKFLAINFIWLISFSIFYFLIKNSYYEYSIAFLKNFWGNLGGFMPVPPKLSWFITTLLYIPASLFVTTNLYTIIVFGIAIITGFISCIKEKNKSLLLVLPVLVTLLASSLKLYPFADRAILFLAPIFIIFMAKNFDILNKLNSKPVIKYILCIFFAILILIQILFAQKGLINFRTQDKMSNIYKFMQENIQEDDYIYVRVSDYPSFNVYNNKYDFSKNIYYGKIYNIQFPLNKKIKFLKNDIADLKAKHNKVWFPFYSNVYNKEIVFLKDFLNKEAKLIKSKVTDKGEVYLYDFSKQKE